MATKTIAWGTGSGNITLTYTGQGNGSVSVKSDANDLYEKRVKSITIKTSKGSPTVTKTVTIKQKAKSLDWTTKNFEYTGGVQSIELPKGKYKLQCWGAQGGTSYGNSNGVGSKGGYSEGVLTLTETTTLYVFVGGMGASSGNGGWNGGGGASGYCSYDNSEGFGETYYACGGGATDISTVTSSMEYSNYRTNRSSASLNSRLIIAGGGAGGAAAYSAVEDVETYEEFVASASIYARESNRLDPTDNTNKVLVYFFGSSGMPVLENGKTYRVTCSDPCERIELFSPGYNFSHTIDSGDVVTITISSATIALGWGDSSLTSSATLDIYEVITTTNDDENYFESEQDGEGGGSSGGGIYPGTQSSAGNGGAFGLGANQTTTNYKFASGAGGGGYYGGGRNYDDYDISTANDGGGGSGYISPSLDSGTTYIGYLQFPSPSGGTEIGHSGNGYARITVL